MSARRNERAEQPDEDNAELTTSEMRRARPASEVPPRLVGETAAAAILKRGRGRPPVEDKLMSTTLRIPASVVAAYQAAGSDWRKRMGDAVKANVGRVR
jgi:uncharacterized protein (DUF4415 family)